METRFWKSQNKTIQHTLDVQPAKKDTHVDLVWELKIETVAISELINNQNPSWIDYNNLINKLTIND